MPAGPLHEAPLGPPPGSDHPTDHDPDGEFLIWMTAVQTHHEHAVTDTQAARGHARHGIYQAICGARFRAASMTAPPQTRCGRCAVLHREWSARRHPQTPSLLHRLTRGLLRGHNTHLRRPTRTNPTTAVG